MHDYYYKLGFWRALVACEGFGAKPLLRIGFGGERFHPSRLVGEITQISHRFSLQKEDLSSVLSIVGYLQEFLGFVEVVLSRLSCYHLLMSFSLSCAIIISFRKE
jgi:hypothetical protein